ncbi:MAG TPA: carboxypeptidase regulatory-like domain-containing protein, partial [candidate division Zixibacteria bacterium]|nr:carboxypeptidase regulatory-like domain-containing protein [candidate division Zixibacteria bacterium]
MNICKSCGVTIHEEGKSFCPACEVSAQEAHEVGLVGDGPDAEKAEVSLEDTNRISVIKLSKTPDKSESQEEDTDKVKTESTEEPVKAPEVPAAASPAIDEERLSFSESPFSAGYGSEEIPKESPVETHKEEPETLSAAMEQGGPKSYLSAEERQALLSDLSAARKAAGGAGGAAVKVSPIANSPKPAPKRPEAAMTVRESHSGARLSDKVTLPTAVARGIAYFSGTHIHLVGGAHMASGEELVFKDRIYVLKEKPGTAGGSRWVYVFPMILLLMAGALLWVISRPNPGGIAGLVLDSRTRSTMPGAKVRLLEQGQTAVTNEAGFFVLPKVPAGSYNIQAQGPGIEGRAIVEVAEGGIAPIIVTLSPTQEEVITQIPVVEAPPLQPPPVETPAAEQKLAGMTLSIDPPDAEAFLDGQSLGSGGIFKDLPSGRHTLSVQRNGYQEWKNDVELKAGRPNRVRVSLVPVKTVPTVSTQPERKGFDDYIKEGQNHLAKNEYAKAAVAFTEAVKIRPGSASAHTLLGEAHWGNREVKAGNTHFLKAARIYADQGAYPKAEELYLKVLEADPNQAAPLLELGNLYVAMGNTEAARETYQLYNKNFGNTPDGNFALGKLEYQERRFKDAAKAFERALASSSKPAMIHGYLVLSYIQSNNKRKAQAAYDTF